MVYTIRSLLLLDLVKLVAKKKLEERSETQPLRKKNKTAQINVITRSLKLSGTLTNRREKLKQLINTQPSPSL